MAGDVAALIEALGYVSAHVVGQSLGGMVAQELVLRHPERVLSLCLLFITPNLSYFIPAGVEVLARDGTPVRDRDGAIEDLLTKESYFASPDYPVDAEWTRRVAGISWDRAPYPDGAGHQMAAIKGSSDLLDDLRSVRVPTVVIHGSVDPLISPDAARAMMAESVSSWSPAVLTLRRILARPHPITTAADVKCGISCCGVDLDTHSLAGDLRVDGDSERLGAVRGLCRFRDRSLQLS